MCLVAVRNPPDSSPRVVKCCSSRRGHFFPKIPVIDTSTVSHLMKRSPKRESWLTTLLRQRDQTSLTLEQRELMVCRIAALLAELHMANGDSAVEGDRQRQRLMGELRRMAIFLWFDGVPDN